MLVATAAPLPPTPEPPVVTTPPAPLDPPATATSAVAKTGARRPAGGHKPPGKAPASDCDPPWTIDADGVKIYKKPCLDHSK
jgi:serine/threonine-protein kinase